jgi:hypothetical protein
MKYFILTSFLFFSILSFSQNVGIGTSTPNASALLELQSTNKGLLLPRVADTTAISSPAKGLLVFANASNSAWFYDGTKWIKAANDNVWTSYQDSIITTQKKYVAINPDYNIYPPTEGLQANGSLFIYQKIAYINSAPTVAQTLTMNNSSSIVSKSDSVVRIFDPGGASNYINNTQGNIALNAPGATGYQISFNPADFGIALGDTLWISRNEYPFCQTNYYERYTNTTSTPAKFNTNSPYLHIIFRSNGDNINGKGFDLTSRALYPLNNNDQMISPLGNSLMFNSSNGAFSAGSKNFANAYSTALGNDTEASGLSSTAIGEATYALGDYSTAMGTFTTAEGINSTAMNSDTYASGENSTAMGLNTTSRAFSSLAIGRYNDEIATASGTNWVETDPLLYIGNGNFNNRSNALVVYKNANTDISGYTRLGKATENAPRIKIKKFTGISSSSQTSFTDVTHGLDREKIIGVQVILKLPGYVDIGPGYSDIDPGVGDNYLYQFQILNTVIRIANAPGRSANILSKNFVVLVTYEE